MQRNEIMSCCACHRFGRRQFLAATSAAACAGAAGLLGTAREARAADGGGKMRIRVVYALHAAQQPGPDWPNKGFDFAPVMQKVTAALTLGCPDMEFVTSTATGEDQAKAILQGDASAGIEGYIVYQMNCWNKVVQTIATSGKPVLYVDFQYGGSGGFLVYMAGYLRAKAKNVGFVASSRPEDLIMAAKCFALVKKGAPPAEFVAATAAVRTANTPKAGAAAPAADSLTVLPTGECVSRLKASKILAFLDQSSRQAEPLMGIGLTYLPFAELNDAWKAADQDQARAIADRWQKTAAKIAGVSRETLEQSAAMYLAQKALLARHGANAITINCLGGFYGGHIHAYPCLGFHELVNEGLIGACECDVRSTASMVAMTTMTQGRPGYISDPVIDTSKREIIYAHCVASNRAFGPKGAANPFEILTHSEDRQGASVRSYLPIGYMTTTVEFDQGRKEVLLHQGRTVENVVDDRACRTKIAAEPIGDIEKLFTQWDQWGWHRVTVYGDLKEPVFALAAALGWKVVEEA